MAGWRVKFDGVCSRCGTSLLRGQEAVWDRSTRSMHCVECPTVSEPPLLVVEPSIDAGVAGGSARREFERRSAKREARIDQKFGRFAGLFKAITVEPQSTRAWAIGARGEEKLAQALAGVEGVRVLHDRRVPGGRSRANIDHVIIGPAGVFVVDAKRLVGRIEIRNRGGFFRSDWRLTVGGRDQSKLARAMNWQVDAVRAALVAAGIDPLPAITPVLCFIDGDWPLIRPPSEFEGVLLEGPGSLRRLVTGSVVLDGESIERLTGALARALPARM